MIKKVLLNLSQVAEKYRLALWILLLLLTMAILMFPVHLEYEYHTIQSLYILGNNLSLFGVLYCVWMLLLLVLILSRREAKWEKLALVCLFVMVFLGFWVIITPYFRHQDEWLNASHVQYLLQEGRITLTPRFLDYFQWPGLHLTGTALSQITGLSIFKVRTLFGVFENLLLATLFYVLLLRYLKNPSIAAIGVVLFILGTITIGKAIPFHPETFGLLFLPLFLILLSRHEHTFLETWQDKLLMIIVFMAITITHLITSLALILILAAIYLVQKIDRKVSLTSVNLVILSIVIFLAWEMYCAFFGFGELLKLIWQELHGIQFYNIFLSAETAMGARTSPLWATGTRIFWWIFVYVFGSILWLKSLFRLKKLSPLEKKYVGGLAGIIALTIIVTLAGMGGFQFARFLKYASFFTIPLILLFILNLDDFKRRFSIALLTILLFALSLPTLFVYNNMIMTQAFYPSEVSGSKFLKSVYGEGEELDIYCGIFHRPLNRYWLPKVNVYREDDLIYFEGNPRKLWPTVNVIVDRFLNWYGEREHSVYVYSNRLTGSYQHVFGFEPTHPEWLKVKNKLSGENKVYTNGDYQIYVPAKPRPPHEETILGD